MQALFQISRKVDYALRVMIYLAGQPLGTRLPLHEIATKVAAPRVFLSKLIKALIDAQMLSALRGPNGGVALARAPDTLSFLDVIEAVEGPVQLNVCLGEEDECSLSGHCTMIDVWRAGQEKMLEVYRTTRLSDLARPPAPVRLSWARASQPDSAPQASTPRPAGSVPTS